tara:strand:+ start:1886 stop:2287 length:402 start_codon:yes stop_codon:yes gene_type:complete
MKLKWERIKLWCFHHWRMLVVAALLIISYAIGRSKVKTYKTQLTMARDLYRKEVDAIENASKNKGELQMNANLKYKRALEIANKTAMDSSNYAELKKAERVRDLVEANKDDPKKIDAILMKEFGIMVMTPGDK